MPAPAVKVSGDTPRQTFVDITGRLIVHSHSLGRTSMHFAVSPFRLLPPVILAIFLCLPASLCAEDPSEIRIAVLAFDNESLTDPVEFEPFRRGIADALVCGLSQGKGFGVIERTRIEALLSELRLNASGLVDPESAQRLGRILGVQALVLGSFAVVEDQARIDARIAEVETGHVLAAEEISGEAKDFFDLEQALVDGIASEFRQRYSARASAAAKQGSSGKTEAGERTGTVSTRKNGAPHRLAVFPFEDLKERSGPGKWGEGIAAGVAGHLSKGPHVEIVDRDRLREVVDGLALKTVDPFGERAATRAGQIVGANVLVLGSFLSFQGRIKVQVRLVKTETGEVIAAARATGKIGDRSTLEEKLATNIIGSEW